ncbi:alpha/beta hydrolase family protein [Rhizobium alvei]|uniref:Alpha/beta fold hydrolase n=1 Tax=Rhizobium alvei TaxID=1132659 RepID=A0ABT8YF70_9HYPH|nr:alpha/beta fold hydrolase [Rhizobium alvei]MDO6962367.1 alpha/beta fold hydrolase [Rhizobium alvei]
MEPRAVEIMCDDGVRLGGHLWKQSGGTDEGAVIINCATGVLSRFYHAYARFLAEHGYTVLTYDYRGIGLSRPDRLRGSGFRWRDWGERDFAAVVDHMRKARPDLPLLVVGHSIGGFLPGYAANAASINRILTVGAQFAYWPDYHVAKRKGLFLKWHLVMPALSLALGYFPGRRLGWLEDLPRGVALEWAFRGRAIEQHLQQQERDRLRAHFASVDAPILAITVSDDEFATEPAVRRALSYYRGSERTSVMLEPGDLGLETVGHFDLFRARHAAGFWLDTLLWLREGINPWPNRRFE